MNGTITAQGNATIAKPLSVLVADDIPASRRAMEASLVKLGLAVDFAGNGLEAVHMVQSHDYDLVLMDISMPIMDGVQATMVIRNLLDPSKAKLPIVAVTAYPWPRQRHQCISAGMNAFLAKPLDTTVLMGMIEGLGRAPVDVPVS